MSWTTWGPLTRAQPLGALALVLALMALYLACILLISYNRTRGDIPRGHVAAYREARERLTEKIQQPNDPEDEEEDEQ